MLKISAVVFLWTVVLGTVTAMCPMAILTRPCKCAQINGNYLRCDNIDHDTLNRVFLRTGPVPMKNVEVDDSKLDSYPALSLGPKLTESLRIADCNMTKLFDISPPPPPLNILRILNLENVRFQDGFQWNELSTLNLMVFVAQNVTIAAVDDSFIENMNPSLTHLALSNTNTSEIVDRAFLKLTNLEEVMINSNQIKTLKRSMFPKSFGAVSLGFENNQIESLPEDMFEGMSRLQSINLSNNKIKNISDKTFSNLKRKISSILLGGNPLHCDCGFKWLVSTRTKYSFTGECATPENLTGKPIKDLKPEDLGSC